MLTQVRIVGINHRGRRVAQQFRRLGYAHAVAKVGQEVSSTQAARFSTLTSGSHATIVPSLRTISSYIGFPSVLSPRNGLHNQLRLIRRAGDFGSLC